MLRIHAIIIALNEEDFIKETIKPIYELCSGISVVTQYDRDYYGKKVKPDNTVNHVLDIDDPDGKIHLVVRRYNDETASRNHEMKAIMFNAAKGIQPLLGQKPARTQPYSRATDTMFQLTQCDLLAGVHFSHPSGHQLLPFRTFVPQADHVSV